jgi:hypothetical protein
MNAKLAHLREMGAQFAESIPNRFAPALEPAKQLKIRMSSASWNRLRSWRRASIKAG